MAGRQPELPLAGPFVCEFCGEVWSSARGLAAHIKVHIMKGKAPAEQALAFPSVPPAAFGPAPAGPRMVPVMPPFFLPPPTPPPALALERQPVAPAAGILIGGLHPLPVRRQAQAPQLRDPVVYTGEGGTIRMVLLEPNHAFWAAYRLGMDDAPVELDFMGLRPRPESPSPSFASWLDA